MIEIHREKDEIAAKNKAAHALNRLLKACGENPILMMVSGGSAMEVLDDVDTESLGENVTITVLDERFSGDPKANNFAQLVESGFYKKVKEKRVQWIDTRLRGQEDLQGLTERFLVELIEWCSAWGGSPGGKIIITQGVGEDGHTAGIMPYPENPELFTKSFDDPKRWAVGYDAGSKIPHPLRVTVTLPFLREKVDHSIVYMVGQNKKETLKRVMAKEGALWEIPARVIHQMKNVFLFTDIP